MNTSNQTLTIRLTSPFRSAIRSFLVPTLWREPTNFPEASTIQDVDESEVDIHRDTRILGITLLSFVIHIVTGVILFIILLAPLIGLYAMTNGMESPEMRVFKLLPLPLIISNFVLFVFFLFRTTFDTIRRL